MCHSVQKRTSLSSMTSRRISVLCIIHDLTLSKIVLAVGSTIVNIYQPVFEWNKFLKT